MTPITKNVRVLDAQGNEHEATYLKRAKGLVKNGRARFINDNTLQLQACPPIKSEDIKMENIDKNMATWEETAERMDEKFGNGPRPEAEAFTQAGISLEWIAERMDAIIQTYAYIVDALKAVSAIEITGEHDIAAKGKADAIHQIVQSREDTNRQALRLLEKMYKDITRPTTHRLNPNEMGIDWETLLHDLPPHEKLSLFREINGM